MHTRRIQLTLTGLLQGIGFRPYVYGLAIKHQLSGWVQNFGAGVRIEVQGDSLDLFEQDLIKDLPPSGKVFSSDRAEKDVCPGEDSFSILPSQTPLSSFFPEILPDLGTCESCIKELFDPKNRRFRHPFISCTHCGPRYSITEGLPFDRSQTSYREFEMCSDCKTEYTNPSDRRFYSQTQSCPKCGPILRFTQDSQDPQAPPLQNQEALTHAALLLQQGAILAIQGIGGFHLVCDAQNSTSVQALRRLKGREKKPLATLFPDLKTTQEVFEVSEAEENLLKSAKAPIVLLKFKNRQPWPFFSEWVCPSLGEMGVMLPYQPIYHLLMESLKCPLVVTSANLSDEPICTELGQVCELFGEQVDGILSHSRKIISRVDDSLVRHMAGTEVVLRLGRGYGPTKLTTPSEVPDGICLLGLGAQQKTSLSVFKKNEIYCGPHIGTLNSKNAIGAYTASTRRLAKFFPAWVETCDLHPDYSTSELLKPSPKSFFPQWIQHHQAHVFSCMAEHSITGPTLGIAWDGSGLGQDGKIWGSEFFSITTRGAKRVASLKPFFLPGGKACYQDIRRTFFGLLMVDPELKSDFAQYLPGFFSDQEAELWSKMVLKKINTLETTSMGRLFDVAALLCGISPRAEYEGQAAMELETIAQTFWTKSTPPTHYPIEIIRQDEMLHLDWKPWFWGILGDLKGSVCPSQIAAKFHATLSEAILKIAIEVGTPQIVLSGGCFQNRILLENTIQLLRENRFSVFWNQRIPGNDGGISVGQVYVSFYSSTTHQHPKSLPGK